jgi:hypothetical protein
MLCAMDDARRIPHPIDRQTIVAVATLLRDVADESETDLRTTVARAAGDHVRGRVAVRIDRAIAARCERR